MRRLWTAFLVSMALTVGLPAGAAMLAASAEVPAANSRPQLEIRNARAAVRITPWRDAKAVLVACGGNRNVGAQHSPSPPWRMTVRDAHTRHVLAIKTLRFSSGYVIVTITRKGVHVLHGSSPPSGPPPVCGQG